MYRVMATLIPLRLNRLSHYITLSFENYQVLYSQDIQFLTTHDSLRTQTLKKQTVLAYLLYRRHYLIYL